MNIEIRHRELRGTFPVDVGLYNRGDALGIDFDNCKAQIQLHGVSKSNARQMIRELEAFIGEQGVDAIEALKILQPYIEDLQMDNHNEPSAGIFYDHKLESGLRLMYKCLGIETWPPKHQPSGSEPTAGQPDPEIVEAVKDWCNEMAEEKKKWEEGQQTAGELPEQKEIKFRVWDKKEKRWVRLAGFKVQDNQLLPYEWRGNVKWVYIPADVEIVLSEDEILNAPLTCLRFSEKSEGID